MMASTGASNLPGAASSATPEPEPTAESLARKVLVAAGLIDEFSPFVADPDAITCSSTSSLSRLERAAGCHLTPLPQLQDTLQDESGGGGSNGGVLTCTDPNESSGGSGGIGSNHKKRPASDVWNPLDAVSSSVSASLSSPLTSSMQVEKNGGDDDDDDCLEDCISFRVDFYRAVGELICHCYTKGAYSSSAADAAAADQYDHDLLVNEMGKESDARYSLPRNNDAVRVTRLLCAMMEYNVDVEESRPGNTQSNKDAGSVRSLFLSTLLRHCEGNMAESATPLSIPSITKAPGADPLDSDHQEAQNTMRRVPIIAATFRHLSSLPALETHVRSWARIRKHSQQAGRSLDIDATVTLATPEPSTTQLSRSDVSDRLRNLKLWENEKDRLEAELSTHTSMIEYLMGSIYKECDADLRGRCRTKLGGLLHVFSLSSGGARSCNTVGGLSGLGHGPGLMGMEDASAAGIDAALKILLRIVEGVRKPTVTPETPALGPSHESLLFDILVPLHKPSGMVLWRDQTPVLGLYHETLVRCVGALLVRNKLLVSKVVRALLHPDIWPTEGGAKGRGGRGGGAGVIANTPKVVLLLHEVDTFIGLLDISSPKDSDCDAVDDANDALISSFSDTILPLTVRLSSCIESDNSRLSERALQYFRNSQFMTLIRWYKGTTMPVLLRALCRIDAEMNLPWNPTVRRMTLLVLTELQSLDKQLFERSCDEAIGNQIKRVSKSSQEQCSRVVGDPTHSGSAIMGSGPVSGIVSQNMTSLRGGMGNWRPPPTGGGAGRGTRLPQVGMAKPPILKSQGMTPPLTITGVAPWAVGAGTNATNTTRKRLQRPTKTQQPGRGVAPWTMQNATRGVPVPRNSMGPPLKLPTETATSSESINKATCEDVEIGERLSSNETGIQRVLRYMEELKPPKVDGEEESGGMSSWARAQMAESPTLLPSLKFHDLVFGKTLGEGSFGVVRYARRIVKDRTRSHWPEYAVKVVSTTKIIELGYEQSINREIATLRIMSHPCIARLISTFRFRDGAYLVLEYASGGDLHTLLKRNGSIDHASSQFVIGELVAALSSIHDAGFVYADLKPENCLITESGHVKLTDFGGCRPVTEEAREMVNFSGKDIIKHLRDGDWKEKSKDLGKNIDDSFELDGSKDNDSDEVEREEEKEEEDFRIEGTTAYLPPEVVVGSTPTTAADAWALGCVLYQCISGRPPLLDDNDHLTRHKIVTFELSSESHEADFFGIHDSSTFHPSAKKLIRILLSRDPHDRPAMHQIANDDFFDGKNVFELHKKVAYPLDVGSVAPVADAKWNRRQFSSIWAPQPKQYAIDALSSEDSSGKTMWDIERNSPIQEGVERDMPFLSTRRPTALMQIGE